MFGILVNPPAGSPSVPKQVTGQPIGSWPLNYIYNKNKNKFFQRNIFITFRTLVQTSNDRLPGLSVIQDYFVILGQLRKRTSEIT